MNLVQTLSGANPWDPSVRILTELPSKTDPLEVAAILIVTLLLTIPGDLLPGAQGGVHRSGAGPSL